MENILNKQTVTGGTKLEPSWFQVFDFLFNRFGIKAPASQDAFSVFLSDLSNRQPEIFVALIGHLNEINSGLNYEVTDAEPEVTDHVMIR